MRNKVIRSFCTTVLILGVSGSALAQPDKDYLEKKGWSLGLTVGNSDLWGDIGTQKMLDHYTNSNYGNYMMPFAGVFTRFLYHPGFTVRTGFNYGMLAAGDDMNVDLAKKAEKYESDEVQRYQRNLDVRVNILEAHLMMEINPLRFSPNTRMAKMRFQPYLLAGIGGYHFQSKGRYINKYGAGSANGNYVNLYDLHIEGDGWEETGVEKYSRFQLNVPLGIGGKWDLSPNFAIGVEYLYRYCFTDYLDGVSQKYIDPKLYDKYLSPEKAYIARAMSDKSWEVDPTKEHLPGQNRGLGGAKNDGYSTISITFFYKFKSRAVPWWE